MKKQTNTINNTFTKKIGQAAYQVQIHFCKNSRESFNDKILWLIRNDVETGAIKVVSMMPPPDIKAVASC